MLPTAYSPGCAIPRAVHALVDVARRDDAGTWRIAWVEGRGGQAVRLERVQHDTGRSVGARQGRQPPCAHAAGLPASILVLFTER